MDRDVTLLPQPDSPTMPSTSPFWTCKLTPSTAGPLNGQIETLFVGLLAQAQMVPLATLHPFLILKIYH